MSYKSIFYFCIFVSIISVLLINCAPTTQLTTGEVKLQADYFHIQGTQAFIDAEGNLYTWGSDAYNTNPENVFSPQLGQGSAVVYNNVPTRILSNVQSLYFCRKAVAKSGELYTWGNGTGEYLESPQVERTGIRAFYGSVYLTEDGDLYGCYDMKAIGQDPPYGEEDTLILHDVTDYCGCIAGRLALRSDGTVWQFKMRSSTLEILSSPVKLISGVARMIHGSGNTVLFLKTDGSLYSYGDNEFGQCGNGEHGDFELKESECVAAVPFCVMRNISDAWVHLNAAYAVTEDGKLYGWGCNDYDLLLTGDEPTSAATGKRSVRTEPTLIMEQVKDFYPCYSHAFAIKNDDSLWSWGVGDTGQLGNGVCTDSEDLNVYALADKIAQDAIYCAPQKVLDGVKRILGAEYNQLVFAEKLDGSLWYWGCDEIIVAETDEWDTKSYSYDFYSRHEIIATPQPFDITTFHQGLGSKSK